MNQWEFHARVFSLTGGGKKFGTRAGGLGLQSIVMELLITCACKRSKVNSELTGGGKKQDAWRHGTLESLGI